MSPMLASITIPTINAILNAIATILLTIGFVLIKQGKRESHRKAMISAFVVSIFFLIGYVANRIIVQGVHTPFGGEGIWRWVYYPMLISHIFLAMFIVPLVLRTLYLGVKGQFEKHRKWAKWTFPMWYYVSFTGVLIYFFLYIWFPVTEI